jgi:hypothetical protein
MEGWGKARLVGGEGGGVIGGGDMWVAVRRGELQSCSCRMADEMDDGRECAVRSSRAGFGWIGRRRVRAEKERLHELVS